jgi:disulfide oxidoreductase YuzD
MENDILFDNTSVTNSCITTIISNETNENLTSGQLTVNSSQCLSVGSKAFTITSGCNSCITTDTSKKITYYVTLRHVNTRQIKNVAFEFAYYDKIPPLILDLLKAKIKNYNDDVGLWTPIGPIVVWTDFFGYLPIIIPEFYETIQSNDV